MEPTTTNSPSETNQQPSSSSSSSDKIICNGCKLTLEENGTASDSVVVSIGNSLWHVDCFRCAKCRNLVEHDTNLLLLSDGSPVCENCSYICSVCKLPISNEAIVTGEESYHADCFRCRSCSNRIEELIFAKTSQGIYCMTCHNERVTRSRRHAEAKRNKSTNPNPSAGSKKDRDRERDKDRPQNSSNHRSRSKTPLPIGSAKPTNSASSYSPLNTSSSTIDPSSTTTNNNNSAPTSSSTITAAHPHLPNLPSHSDPSKSLSSLPNTPRSPNPPLKSKSSSNSLLNSYLNHHQPGLASSHGSATSAKDSNSFDQAHRALQTSKSASQVPANRRRGGSASSVHVLPTSQSGDLRTHPPISLLSQASSNLSRPSTADGNGPSISPLHSHFTSSAINRSYESSPHLPPNQSHIQSDSERIMMDRNRTIVPKTDQVDPKLRVKHRSVSLSSFDELTLQNPLKDPSSHPGPGSDTHHNNLNTTLDNTAFSYNDIFSSLDHNPEGQADDPTRLMSQLELSAIDIEDLLATPTAADSGDTHVASTTPGPPEIEEITKKVRESISLSRDKPTQATGLGLDVGLVEKLLWELDETKERMKALQDEYQQMKRVSRTAYEGFSLARQNYDNQVLQREEAEAKMNELKTRMIEQASKLREMDSLRTLEYQSEELKDSVSGLQKHVSQLVAERDFRIAEVEALNHAKKEGELPAGEALSERFDQLRHRYLQELQDLATERDRLKEEVAHLTNIRESQAKELASLNQRQDALTEMNASAVKRLEETKSTTSRILGRYAASASAAKPSLQSPTALTGQPGSQESDFPIQMSPEVNIATTRKFKWGKSHTHKASTATSSRQHQHAKNASSISTPESVGINNGSGNNDGNSNHHLANNSNSNNLNHLPNNSSSGNLSNAAGNPGANSNSSNTASSSIVGLRPHSFQPVSALRPVRCDYCGDKLWGLAEVRCTACGSYSHTKCAANFFGCHASNGPNNPSQSTSSGSLILGGSNEEDAESVLFGNDLIAQARAENKLVPSVVTKCIEAVEEQGLNFEGIYRKTGGMSSVKMIQNCFERGQSMNFNDLDKFNDISAITSTLKNYFRQLPNPLFTFELHEAFVTVATMAQENIRLEALERVIYQLPAVHFETLKVLMNHLSKIEKQSEHNKMTSQNLGVIFGPTLLRSSNPHRQFSDMPFTAKIVELTVLNRPLLFRKPFGAPSSSSPSSSPSNNNSASNQSQSSYSHHSNQSISLLHHQQQQQGPHHHLLTHSSPVSNHHHHHHHHNGIQQPSSSASSSSASNLSCNPQPSSSASSSSNLLA
ncbi:uncharacterized protein PGTG_00754 [Puccinia graminis f. sp. tritici CRL 75-36-700-3]|uniref:Rho-type gtpase-activating protein n=1 Tax=Puccinia graminis f. sp. tritici (strain CRL 75-36-700-3 / race SCCL) TaxID=418459 RepID=E3JTU1_PUCGT|nr:uncharacterized protein PGTG_00754 [Puccinia graminis f. sp. tritici CRL 75-36-700-3]EFP75423.2 hypothetical protein PGTG_00754 [Puccinia graminis f. sp. tritici CRL 75-36-700-3]